MPQLICCQATEITPFVVIVREIQSSSPRSRDHIGTVVLVDRRTRCVEVLGPELMGSRYATDRQLVFHEYQMGMTPPQRIGLCIQADERRARFLIDEGERGDRLLDLLARHPKTPARPVRPYGVKGWLVEG